MDLDETFGGYREYTDDEKRMIYGSRRRRERDEPCEQFKGKADALCGTCGWGRCYHPVCLGPPQPQRRVGPLRDEMGKLLRFPDAS